LKNRQKFMRTYYGLGSETILLAVMLKIIESLGTRHYATIVLVEK